MLKAMFTATTYGTIFTSCPKDWNETEQMDMMLSPSPSSLSSLPFKVERCLLRKAQIYINMHYLLMFSQDPKSLNGMLLLKNTVNKDIALQVLHFYSQELGSSLFQSL